jgi:hypothetical protein
VKICFGGLFIVVTYLSKHVSCNLIEFKIPEMAKGFMSTAVEHELFGPKNGFTVELVSIVKTLESFKFC